MERVYFNPSFTHQVASGPIEHCAVEVYADEQRHQVKVVVHTWPSLALRSQPHMLVNTIYRKVLFKLLNPASWVKWCCCLDGSTHQTIQLEGLPGGYTSGQVSYSMALPRSVRQATG